MRRQASAWFESQPNLNQVVVDLGAVTFMDSTGMGALIGMRKWVAARNGALRLARPRPNVKLVLEITRANKTCSIFTTLEEAPAPAAALT